MIIKKESSFTHLDRDNLMDGRLTVARSKPSKSNACHNSFPLDLDDHKNKMESPPIFSIRV